MSLEVDIKLGLQGFGQRIQFDCSDACVTGLFGPSGSGKTSLLRSIAGFERQRNAKIVFNGDVWQDGQAFLPTFKRRLAFVFQEASLFEHLSVERNLEFAIERVGKEDSAKIDKAMTIELLGLKALLNRRSCSLSGGERQRVAMARALCSQPRLLLMDEPLSALDARAKAEILPLFEAVCQATNTPILYVSHSIDEIARLADSLVLIEKGGLLAQGETADLLSRLDLPLAKQVDATSILEGEVISQDSEYGLTYLATQAGQLTLTHANDLILGSNVRVKLCARDISIALNVSGGTSILNSIEATIIEVEAQDNAQTLVKLSACGAPVIARITRKSSEQLKLTRGLKVILQIKSVALL